VSTQIHVDAVLLLPDLGVAWIEIEINAAANVAQGSGVGTKLVEKQVDIRRNLADVIT
jgi:hypothetical protein